MPAGDAMRLIAQELVLDGDPERNLATFVTTWMEPEAQRLIADEPAPQLHRPRRVPAHGGDRAALHPDAGATSSTRPARPRAPARRAPPRRSCSGRWRSSGNGASAVRPRASLPTGPNLVFGGDVHVVWEKFCRYFDVEPRIVPLQEGKYTIGPEDVEPHVDENTIGVAAVLGTTFTGHADDIPGINDFLVEPEERQGTRRPAARGRRQRRLRVAVPVPALRVGLPPRAGALDQRLRTQVRPRVPGRRVDHLPGAQRPSRGARLRGELPRQDGRRRSR